MVLESEARLLVVYSSPTTSYRETGPRIDREEE